MGRTKELLYDEVEVAPEAEAVSDDGDARPFLDDGQIEWIRTEVQAGGLPAGLRDLILRALSERGTLISAVRDVVAAEEFGVIGLEEALWLIPDAVVPWRRVVRRGRSC